MIKKLSSVLILILVISVSLFIMVLPTFFTKGISRVSLNKELNLPLVLNDKKDIKLIFFGYSGCAEICTPRLYSLNKFYKTLNENEKKRVGVDFFDISIPTDNSLPQKFAEFFNPDFKGIYLDENNLRNYTKEFNVYFSKSLTENMEYDHTVNLYLLKKTKDKKEIRYIYNSYPYDFEQIKLDIEELMNE